MKVKLKYFGLISELTGRREEVFELSNDVEMGHFISLLEHKYERLKSASYKVAVNQIINNGNIELNENDEIALLPAFAGG